MEQLPNKLPLTLRWLRLSPNPIGGSCSAAEYEQPSCILHPNCLHRVPSESTSCVVIERSAPSWPARAQLTRSWRTNATIVISSFAADLAWSSRLPRAVFDLVVYQKVEVSRTNQYGLELAAQRFSAIMASLCPRAKHSCLAASPLAYFAALPNYGHNQRGDYDWWVKRRGGGREPQAYFQFLVDFYRRLPAVVIFAQDDCSTKGYKNCPWLTNLHQSVKLLNSWQIHWREGVALAPPVCGCRCTSTRCLPLAGAYCVCSLLTAHCSLLTAD